MAKQGRRRRCLYKWVPPPCPLLLTRAVLVVGAVLVAVVLVVVGAVLVVVVLVVVGGPLHTSQSPQNQIFTHSVGSPCNYYHTFLHFVSFKVYLSTFLSFKVYLELFHIM